MVRVLSPIHPPILFIDGCDSLAEALHPQIFQRQLYKRDWRRGRCLYPTQSGPDFSGDLYHQERVFVQANHGNMGAWKQHDLSISLDDP